MKQEGQQCIPEDKRMITFKHKGDFSNTLKFLDNAKNLNYLKVLDHYGKLGVDALSSATPIATGKTASSWGYEISKTENGYSIYWTNSNMNKNISIALIIQYGHGTGWGGYVQGIDYINPAIRPIFDGMANSAWEEVAKR